MAAELAVSVLLFGRSPHGFVGGYRTAPRAIGLAAQVAFGLMPLVRPCAGARTGLESAMAASADVRISHEPSGVF
jgi:hypothetical protein